ncbi:hypothetical protein [Nostoc sp. NZL]|uniref:hypothetical protein n=1 Tax=Nostoc sp. NZL TaxID=2650612 RepID=UPI0018C72DAB|nr:hypothetical protein [Nostoc sp. NZL]MBG1241359.1 hypothetical protein [Nostoc sp. NZL]
MHSQETGIANVALFDLIVRGYLQFSEQSISQVPNHPDASHLQPIEREIFDKLSSSSTVQTSLWLKSLFYDSNHTIILLQNQYGLST